MNQNDLIYVAGHTGLVGSAIARRLRALGHANLVMKTHGEMDLTCQAAVNAFFEKERPSYVFVAAARVGGIFANDTYPAEFIRENLFIAANLIDAAYRFGAQKLLFLGSSCLYPKHAPQPMKEDYLLTGPMEPTNQWYGAAKAAGIKMAQAYAKQYGFNAICAMPTNLYGPADNFDLENSHVIPALLRKFHLAKLASQGDFSAIERDAARFGTIPQDLAQRLRAIAGAFGHPVPGDVPEGLNHPEALVFWGSGSPLREFLHVDDLADAAVFLMQEYNNPELINVGAGQELSIKELAGMVRSVVEYEGPVVWDAEKPDGSPRKLLEASRLASLGWTPKVPLEDGLVAMYRWYLRQTRIEP